MNAKSVLVLLVGGLFSYLLYNSDVIGGGMFFILLVILFIVSAVMSGNAQTKAIVDRGSFLNQKLQNLEGFTATRKYIGNRNKYLLALDENNKRAVCIANNARVFSFEDVLGCEIIEDGHTVSHKSTSRTIGGAIVGGVIAGGAGAIIGGLSGKNTINQEISNLSVKIRLRDLNDPSIILYCFSALDVTSGSKKSIKSDDSIYGPIYKIAKREAENIKDLISVIIENEDKRHNITLINPSFSDELFKLNELKEKGVLTIEEFDIQKRKLLSN